MSSNLLIAIRLHEGRYHGAGEDSPSPARCFQALVAAASQRGRVDDAARGALEWLEARRPPIVAMPELRRGQAFKAFVPNNDLDAVGGDPANVEKIRTAKSIEPKLFAKEIPFLFAWDAGSSPGDADHAGVVARIAERLYQFGRGVDMAWARARVLDEDALEALLARFPGPVLRPTPGVALSGGSALPCPEPGSLSSLEARHQAFRRRFRAEGKGESFSQPPKPRFAQVTYGAPPARRLYEIHDPEGHLRPVPMRRIVSLVETVRDAAAARFRGALPASRAADVERGLVGRTPEGVPAIPPDARVRILPLPSIGHDHADRGIRRVLVEMPGACPLRAPDVEWAFSALAFSAARLTPASDDAMLRHYGITGEPARTWRTVTPAALQESATRRRIEPSKARTVEEAKPGAERAREESAAAAAVRQALRHAGSRAEVAGIRVQREPFEAKGVRVEQFAAGTRFEKERLWHVEVTFAVPIGGPLVIGDGRFLGLGILAPAHESTGVFAFRIESGLDRVPDPVGLSRALRRAVMARVQEVVGLRTDLAPYFTGHDGIRRDRSRGRGGEPAKSEVAPHLAFLYDPPRTRLLVIAPHLFERREPLPSERGHLRKLEDALCGFVELRAGGAGLLRLRSASVDLPSDPLFAPSRQWESVTDYAATRHGRHATAVEALGEDLRVECARPGRGLAAESIHVTAARGREGVGLVGAARLEFAAAVRGPILLGRTRFVGGGLFAGVAGGTRV